MGENGKCRLIDCPLYWGKIIIPMRQSVIKQTGVIEETVRGIVDRVTYHNSDNGFSILRVFPFRLLTDEANLRVKSSFQRIFSPLEIIFSLAQPIQMSLHDFTNQITFFKTDLFEPFAKVVTPAQAGVQRFL